jgi:hypothetical protein
MPSPSFTRRRTQHRQRTKTGLQEKSPSPCSHTVRIHASTTDRTSPTIELILYKKKLKEFPTSHLIRRIVVSRSFFLGFICTSFLETFTFSSSSSEECYVFSLHNQYDHAIKRKCHDTIPKFLLSICLKNIVNQICISKLSLCEHAFIQLPLFRKTCCKNRCI